MIHRLLIATMLATLTFGCASPRNDPAMAYNAPTPTRPSQTDAWMKSSDYNVEGRVPAMAASRTVNEQDCTKPIDLTAGNLRCR